MGFSRCQIDRGGNQVNAQAVGDLVLSQASLAALTTVGAGTITAGILLAGVIQRTGPVGAYIDTFPSADSLLLAEPDLSIGDSFEVLFRNTVAQAMTAAAAEGVVLGTNVDVAASLVRSYLITILGDGLRQSFNANTTNASAIITGLSQAVAGQLRPGQGITGTGIPANSFVTSVNYAAGTATLNANATATGTPALTSFPRYQLQGLFSTTL